ncbi:hypothetical protein R5R35_009140 [Gryllus longicercus]|uniref:Uncharacterized protein n=1 Tax=Gryllus longicercus TaxID=2509291 RepID=A0AAN9WDU2_9ORTH
MKNSVDEQEPPSPEQSQNRNIEDIKHDQPEANTQQLDGTQPGGSKLEKCSKNHTQRSSISICDTNKDVEYFPHALTEAVVKNTEPEKSESAGTSKEGAVEVSPNPSITSAHSLESHLTEEKYSSISENEDSNTTSLREMFPDLPIPDENLSLKRLQQMSTTDITKQIVSLNKPAILKPTNRLIPQSKIWLSPLQEVDKQQEAEAEKEIVPWDSNPTDQESDSESSEEIELNIDLEDDEKA